MDAATIAQWAQILAPLIQDATKKPVRGDLQFKRQPESPEEKAVRLRAEMLAGVTSGPGSMPTYNYLMPQIDARLRNLTASTGGYQPLDRLDVATGKAVPRVAAPPTVAPATAPIFNAGGTTPAAPVGNTVPTRIGGAGENVRQRYRSMLSAYDENSGGPGFQPAYGETVADFITRTNATPGQLNSAFPSGWVSNAGAQPGDAVRGGPAGATFGSMDQLIELGRTYGMAGAQFIIGLVTANPGMTINGARSLYQNYQDTHALPQGVNYPGNLTPGTGRP